ncbi:MAG: RIP metalloprotease RseP [Fidelibacterota bacterium]
MTTLWATIIVLGVIVTVHEIGHFLAARSVGVRVDRFSIGFPPRLITFTSIKDGWLFTLYFYRFDEDKKLVWGSIIEKTINKKGKIGSGCEYCLAIIPLGGYVKMAGVIDENLDDTFSNADDELMNKSSLAQAWVMSAGVIMNIVLAFILFTGVAKHTGIPEVSDEPVIAQLVPDMPAIAAGLQVGDRIISINEEEIESWSELSSIIHEIPNTEISLTLERDNIQFNTVVKTSHQVALIDGKMDTLGAIGIIQQYSFQPIGFVKAIQTGFVATINGFGMIITSISMLVNGEASLKDIGGPVLIAQLAGETAKAGWAALLTFMALISCNLAFINILPIPGLDGGHILIIIIEGIIRHKLSIKARMVIQQVGMAFLLLLFATVIVNDIGRLIGQ